VAALATSSIAPLDPSRGLLIALPRDCEGTPSAGVELSLAPSAGATPFYFAQQRPSTTATATGDENGFAAGGFVNAAANTGLALSATVAANGLVRPVPPVRASGRHVVRLPVREPALTLAAA